MGVQNIALSSLEDVTCDLGQIDILKLKEVIYFSYIYIIQFI